MTAATRSVSLSERRLCWSARLILLACTMIIASCCPGETREKTASDRLFEYLRSRHFALASFHRIENRYPDTEEFSLLLGDLHGFASSNGLAVEHHVSPDSYSVAVYPVTPKAAIKTEWLLRPDGLWRRVSEDRDSAVELLVPMTGERGGDEKGLLPSVLE
jgi:hypothetical protein